MADRQAIGVGIRHLHFLAAPALLILGLLIAFGPVYLTGFGVVSGARGDPRLVNYTLENGYRWLVQQAPHESFWDPPIFFPVTNMSAYTDVLIGSGIMYWPWRLLGYLPDTSYSLWLTSVCCANYILACFMLRSRFQLSFLASSAGAYLFSFGSTRMANVGHLQLFPQFWILLAAISIMFIFDARSSDTKKRICFGLSAGALVLQAYTAFYTFYFFALMGILILAIALCMKSPRQLLLELVGRHWLALTFTAAGATAAILPLILHYLEAHALFGDFDLLDEYIPKLYSWLLMGPRNMIYGAIQ